MLFRITEGQDQQLTLLCTTVFCSSCLNIMHVNNFSICTVKNLCCLFWLIKECVPVLYNTAHILVDLTAQTF